VVVDDSLATGVTARAALQALRAKGAGRLVLVVPVGSASTTNPSTSLLLLLLLLSLRVYLSKLREILPDAAVAAVQARRWW
jgi:uncharacterized heparinase superfamily protein